LGRLREFDVRRSEAEKGYGKLLVARAPQRERMRRRRDRGAAKLERCSRPRAFRSAACCSIADRAVRPTCAVSYQLAFVDEEARAVEPS
jgi:hypothetical protein